MAVTDDAIEKIKAKIVRGDLRPGDRLPRESDLAADLGVSRNSLREAVRALSLIRVLDVRQGDGTYVSTLEPKELLDALGFLIELHQDSSVLDILQVRRILEPAATALAAVHMTPEAMDEVAAVIDQDSLDTTVVDLVEHDLRFHGLIAQGSGNPVLASLIESVSMPTARARTWRGLTQVDALPRTINEHAAILQALRERDPQLAQARAIVHIAGVEDWVRQARAQGDFPQ